MATLICPDNFVPTNVSVKVCFCGKQTVEDHDFCFCSPYCARADSMRALGDDDCHYRKVMRSACGNSGPTASTIHRHKSEYHLRGPSNAGGTSTISHRLHHPPMPIQKPLPALPEATRASLAREARYDPRRPWQSRTEFMEPTLSPNRFQHTVERSLTSKTSFGQGVRNSVASLLRKAQQTAPLKVHKKRVPFISRGPSAATVPVDAMDEEEEDAAFRRMLDEPENVPMAHPQATRRSGRIRRSASFAGCNSLTEDRRLDEERGTLMQFVFELRQTRDKVPEPVFDERSDEE